MTQDNVISFGSRKPLAVEQAEQAIMVEEAEKAQEHALTTHQEVCLKMIDNIRELVAAGRLQGLVMIGREPTTGLFMTELAMHDQVTPRHELFAYVGALETIKMELADAAAMAPTLLATGEVVDPWDQVDEDEDDGQ